VAERRGPEPPRAHDRAAADIFSAADTDGPTGTTNANGSSPGDAMALFVIAVSTIEARRQNRADSG
jgi:hypothetical protein